MNKFIKKIDKNNNNDVFIFENSIFPHFPLYTNDIILTKKNMYVPISSILYIF